MQDRESPHDLEVEAPSASAHTVAKTVRASSVCSVTWKQLNEW